MDPAAACGRPAAPRVRWIRQGFAVGSAIRPEDLEQGVGGAAQPAGRISKGDTMTTIAHLVETPRAKARGVTRGHARVEGSLAARCRLAALLFMRSPRGRDA